MTRYFAYGAHEFRESCCPAVRAGFEEVKNMNKRSRYQRQLYTQYDRIVKRIVNKRSNKGIVKENIAEEAWKRAKKVVEYPESVEFAEQVEEELGWD
jgi:hypothetical protein